MSESDYRTVFALVQTSRREKHTDINFVYGTMLGSVTMGGDREEAKEFESRATARRWAAAVGHQHDYRVMRIAKLRESEE